MVTINTILIALLVGMFAFNSYPNHELIRLQIERTKLEIELLNLQLGK